MDEVIVERIFPTVALMEQWFAEFNEQFFDGELEEIELRVGRLTRKTHGCFYDPKDEGFHPGKCYIALNVKIMDTLEGWRLVMLHEMVHYYVYKHFGKVKRSHGKEFKDVAKRIKEVAGLDITTYVESFTGTYRSTGKLPNLKTVHLKEPFILVFCEENPWIDEIEDEGKIYQIEMSDYRYAFKIEEQYIPNIIASFRGMNVRLRWMRVTECSIETRRIKSSCYAPGIKDWSFDKDAVTSYYSYLTFEYDYGKTTWEEIGKTLVTGDKVDGFVPLCKDTPILSYEEYAEGISSVAAKMIKDRYQRNKKMFKSVFKHLASNHFYECSKMGDFIVMLDSRFKNLVAFSPGYVFVNPMYSEKMMDAIFNENWSVLEGEIKRIMTINLFSQNS